MVIEPNKELFNRISGIVTKHGHDVSIHRFGYMSGQPGYIRVLFFNDVFLKLIGGSHSVNIFIYGEGVSVFNKLNLSNGIMSDGGYYRDQTAYKQSEIPDDLVTFIEKMEEYFG